MIYVSQEQLDQVEYIIEQSSRGHHILFDNELIRRVFAKRKSPGAGSPVTPREDFGDESDEEVERHIESLILQPTLVSKKAYLENLEPELLERVIRSYFLIVENNIFEGIEFHQ